MVVRLIALADGKRMVMATLSLVDGEVQMQGKVPPHIERLLADLRKSAKSPKNFLRSLPGSISGTYLRAELSES